jgi:hypothetical protein
MFIDAAKFRGARKNCIETAAVFEPFVRSSANGSMRDQKRKRGIPARFLTCEFTPVQVLGIAKDA